MSSPCTAWLARCAASTSLWSLPTQRLPVPGSTRSPLLSPGGSPPWGQVGSAWGGRGSAPGCSCTCDDQADMTHAPSHHAVPKGSHPFPTIQCICTKQEPQSICSLIPQVTASLQHLNPLCPVLCSQCAGAQLSQRRLMRSIFARCRQLLQPVPHQADTPSLHVVFKGICPLCYPMCTHTAV